MVGAVERYRYSIFVLLVLPLWMLILLTTEKFALDTSVQTYIVCGFLLNFMQYVFITSYRFCFLYLLFHFYYSWKRWISEGSSHLSWQRKDPNSRKAHAVRLGVGDNGPTQYCKYGAQLALPTCYDSVYSSSSLCQWDSYKHSRHLVWDYLVWECKQNEILADSNLGTTENSNGTRFMINYCLYGRHVHLSEVTAISYTAWSSP